MGEIRLTSMSSFLVLKYFCFILSGSLYFFVMVKCVVICIVAVSALKNSIVSLSVKMLEMYSGVVQYGVVYGCERLWFDHLDRHHQFAEIVDQADQPLMLLVNRRQIGQEGFVPSKE